MKIGVFALQGDVREHLSLFQALGHAAVPVKTTPDLEAVDALVIPGGESTTMGFLASEHGLIEPIRKRVEAGMPVFGTCAGAILLAREVRGGDVPKIGVLDIAVHRNAYGRQVDSFEQDVAVDGIGTITAVFIRAPVIDEVGEGVEVLASHDGRPAVVRQGRVLAATFHPEIAGEDRLHRFFIETVCT